MTRHKPRVRPAKGVILVSVLIITMVLLTIGLALLGNASSQYRLANNSVYRDNALLSAEAGIEQSVEMLNLSETFAGYSTPQQFFNDNTQGRGTFTTSITNTGTGNAKNITSTGLVYRSATSNVVVSKRIVKVTVVGTSSAGYSVHTGPGGLILSGSANITNSEVYVNGKIDLRGTSKIGTQNQPLKVYAANMSCPTGSSPGPTYPQVCSSASPPITMAPSTNIYGTVCATGQTSTGPNNNIQTGNGGQGLIPGCTAPTVTQPTYDRAAHIAAMTTNGASTSNIYVCNQSPFNRTWPDKLKLAGNVSINGSCDITIKGDAYITGDLSLGGAAKIRVDNSVGTTRPTIVVDGSITIGGSSSIIANSSGTGAYFASFKSSASCGAACTSLSGNDLKTSQGTTTVDIGGAGNLPGMVFQAYWGKLVLTGSGNIGSVIGQTVDLGGAGTVIFGTSLSSGARTWAITSYQRLNNP